MKTLFCFKESYFSTLDNAFSDLLTFLISQIAFFHQIILYIHDVYTSLKFVKAIKKITLDLRAVREKTGIANVTLICFFLIGCLHTYPVLNAS